MFRIYFRSSRTNLLKDSVILQHSRFQSIHYSSSYNLPKIPKASEESKILNEDPPVKRARRKTTSSNDVDAAETLPMKAKKTRKKTIESEDVEEEHSSANKPVKPRSRKRNTLEAVGEQDVSRVEPTKPRRRKSASSRSIADNQDKLAEEIQITSDTSESPLPPIDSVKRSRARPKMKGSESSLPPTELVKRPGGRSKMKKVSEAPSLAEISAIEPERPEERQLYKVLTSEHGETEVEQVEPILDPPEDEEIDENEFIKIPHALRRFFTDAHKAGSAMGDRSRINIVNERLCDDILDRLEPSLSKHAGCDIIDIHPGIGFWSSKIHDFLKPRTHILMEPDSSKYLPFLQPLLDAENSTYRHVAKSGTTWDYLRQIMTPEFLPHQVKYSSDDPKINEPNDTLLVIANLGHYPKKKYRGFDSISQLVMYQLLAAARSHALFHQYGLIRMLLWIPDDEKTTWVVRHVAQIRKNSVESEITTRYIREIASSTEETHRFVRDAEAALQNSIEVVRKMASMGIESPEHRKGRMERLARKSLAEGGHQVKVKDTERFKRIWQDEYNELERREREGTLERHAPEEPGRKPGKKTYSKDYRRYIFLKAKSKTVNGHGELTDALVKDYNEINELRRKIAKGNYDSESHESARIRTLIENYDRRLSDLNNTARNILYVRLDGARITTEFEKRDAEPLKVYSKEFRPAQPMALLDVQPQAIWPILRENFPANYDVLEYILSTVFAHPIDSVHDSLERLWPGALEALSDKCPSLLDPTKGGAFDLKHMTIRMLTPEMWKEIMEAWMKWPFRPTRFELMCKSGSAVYDADMEEDALEAFQGTS